MTHDSYFKKNKSPTTRNFLSLLLLDLHDQKRTTFSLCAAFLNRGSAFDNAIIKISWPELETDPPPTISSLSFSLALYLSRYRSNQCQCCCETIYCYRQVSPNTALSARKKKKKTLNCTQHHSVWGRKQLLTFEVTIKRRAGGMLMIYRQDIPWPTRWVIGADGKNWTC